MDGPSRGAVLVTGGAGFLGSHIVEALLCQGRRVVLLDAFNSETSSSQEKQENMRLLNCAADVTPEARLVVHEVDLRDAASVVSVLKGEKPTACVHCASLVMDRRSVEAPSEFLEHNCRGTVNLFEAACAAATVSQLVYLSSRSVYGDKSELEASSLVDEEHPLRPINFYGASKIAAEQVCYVYHRLHQISVRICRFFPVYGPRGRPDMFPRRLLESIVDDREIEIFGHMDATRDWLYADDAVDGVLRALGSSMPFEIFNFGTGTGVSLRSLIAAAESVSGRRATFSVGPARMGDARFVGVCDAQKARRLLGWAPKTDLRTGLRRTLDYMQGIDTH